MGDDEKDLFQRSMNALGVDRREYPGGRATSGRATNGRAPGACPPRFTGRSGRVPRTGAGALTDSVCASPLIDRTGPDDTVLFVRAGVARARWKDLRRGRMAMDEIIDLHGMRSHEAESALENFLGECLADGARNILVIHGKGRGSGVRGGVLRPLAINWLRTQPGVLAFCQALPTDGGSGALYVLLKNP
jgi:DNA-nicking Smr family endonuclease